MKPRTFLYIAAAFYTSAIITRDNREPVSQFAPYRQQVIDVNKAVHQEYQLLKEQGAKFHRKEKVKKHICSRMLENKQEDCEILIDMYHDQYKESETAPTIAHDDVVAQKKVFYQERPHDFKG